MDLNISRKVVLDTETTGMNNSGGSICKGHRIIEIGAVEIINRKFTHNNFHTYVNPNRLIDPSAFKIHGISDEFLLDKPKFEDVYQDFLKYIQNSEIIIHNANFDIRFLNYEFSKLNIKTKKIFDLCNIIDTLKIARSLFPGKKNNLDALCKRYKIYTTRQLHSAIQDAKILAKIYLRMTRIQKEISFHEKSYKNNLYQFSYNQVDFNNSKKSINVYKLTEIEKNRHDQYLKEMNKFCSCLWMS
ncbi:DNA polymerase III subunit epsilon [Buchnera aphidicola (Phyllaphis fagi)]|uniref:DNA polymerase III subunit epsilon n=1 Tax=Buchnera aphidicola TaxID=9 RepID=UPI00346495AF